jgi:hypothetical protein
VSTEQVALIPRCAECEARWLPVDEELAGAPRCDEPFDEPPELAFSCPDCAKWEFNSD